MRKWKGIESYQDARLITATPYDVEAIKALYENARKELARNDHSKDIKTWIEFKPEQQNVADIV